MSKPVILSETPITMAELKSELASAKKRDEELNMRALRTAEYLDIFKPVSFAKAKELIADIEKLKVPRLGMEHIVKIVDLMPGDVEDLKTILSGYTITVTKDNMAKIVKVVDNYHGK